TYGALVTEGTLSVLLFVPFFQKWTRRVILFLVWSLHGIIAASARLGPFSYAMMLFPVLLLGAEDFAFLTRRFRSDTRRVRVVIDGGRPFVFFVARVLDRFDPFDRLSFVDRLTEAELPEAAPRDPLFVIDRHGTVHRHTDAWYELLKALPFGIVLAIWLRLPLTRTLAERLCRAFEKRHGAFGRALGIERKSRDPSVARPASLTPETPFSLALSNVFRSLREAAVVLLGVAVVSAILHDNRFVPAALKSRQPEWIVAVIEYPRLLQGWSMFAPEPPYEDGRVVVDGRTADGRKFDPLSGGEPSFDPFTATGWGHEQFWCDYHNYIRFGGNEGRRQFLRQYLLRQHELTDHPENRLVAFDVWWVQDRSPPPGVTRGTPLPPEKLLSYGHVADSGAKAWLAPRAPEHETSDAPLLGP
ncbi:MAG TPA: hypothetical protein VF103_16580, partial [Polyangiaceae bacterium]